MNARDALLDDTFDLAAVFEPAGHLGYINTAGRRLLGLEVESSDRLRMMAMVASSDLEKFTGDVMPTLDTTGVWSGQIHLLRASGAEIPTRSTVRALGDGSHTWVARDLTETKAVMERIAQRTFYDEVTGLRHRSIFLDKLDLALRRIDRPSPVAVLFVNIDRFKDKNDRFGLDNGNLLLKDVANRLNGILDDERDTLARWGGDEFVILRESVSVNVDIADEAVRLAEEIADAFGPMFQIDGSSVFMTASVGIATAKAGEVGTDEMMRHADSACQYAKNRGGACHHFFDEEMRTRAWRRAEVEAALAGATERGELVLHYQPEILLRNNRIVACEALLRWHHPDWGLVSPAEFIPVAEDSNLILEVGEFVLAEGMRQCAEWQHRFPDRHINVAINLSGRQFQEPGFVDGVARHIERTGVDPTLIVLELTESLLMAEVESAIMQLRSLKQLGVRIAVDDFGTGYSSLSYLRQFPVDILKVDQSFVLNLGHDPGDSAIVHAVVSMGKALGLVTIAEGVETAHHLIELRELSCDIAQGYHFARPQPADEVSLLLAAGDDWMD